MHEGVYGGMRTLIAQSSRCTVGDGRLRFGIQEHAVIANAEQARELVTHHDDGYAETIAQLPDQIIEVSCGHRIKSR